MTDYEKLIKEARTLEGMYYDGKKIIQSIASIDCIGGLSFMLQDGEDDAIYSSEDFEINDALNNLDKIKKQCYKPLTKVCTITTSNCEYNKYKTHVNATYYLSSISKNVIVEHSNNLNEFTDINLIHEEIRRILNKKKDSKK